MSKKNKVLIPHHSFYEKYLTWQIANVTPATAHILGVSRFIILIIILIFIIISIIYLPHLLGYFPKF